MNTLLPKALTTSLAMAIATALPLFSLQVNAEQAASGFDKNRLHLGAGVSYNHIDMPFGGRSADRSEEHTSELQSRPHLVCRLLLEKKKKKKKNKHKKK